MFSSLTFFAETPAFGLVEQGVPPQADVVFLEPGNGGRFGVDVWMSTRGSLSNLVGYSATIAMAASILSLQSSCIS